LGDGQITDGKYLGEPLVHDRIDGSVPVPHAIRTRLFRILGKRVRASRFLDLCAGTGMIGIEAISRGALLASFVERKAKRCAWIRKNLSRLEIKDGHGEVFEEETQGFLKRMSAKGRFWDVSFYDPPFDTDYEEALSFIGTGAAVRPGGVVVVRHPSVMFFEENLGVLKRLNVVEFSEESITIFERKA
jgi:16S rRNA (guanine966-N2)-methyltransferase